MQEVELRTLLIASWWKRSNRPLFEYQTIVPSTHIIPPCEQSVVGEERPVSREPKAEGRRSEAPGLSSWSYSQYPRVPSTRAKRQVWTWLIHQISQLP
jgi:hypothetical protein